MTSSDYDKLRDEWSSLKRQIQSLRNADKPNDLGEHATAHERERVLCSRLKKVSEQLDNMERERR